MLEDLLLETTQRAGRFESQLAGQIAPVVLIRLQGLDLTPGPVEREHQLRTDALAHRVGRDRLFQVADKLSMLTEA